MEVDVYGLYLRREDVQKYMRVAVIRDSVPVIDVTTVSHILCSGASKRIHAK